MELKTGNNIITFFIDNQLIKKQIKINNKNY